MRFSISYDFVCFLCLTIVVQHCPRSVILLQLFVLLNTFLKNLKNCYNLKISIKILNVV